MERSLSFLREQIARGDEMQAELSELLQLHESKLWFQLSAKLLALSQSAYFARPPRLVELLRGYIKPIEGRLKPLHLARVVVGAAAQLDDRQARLELLNGYAEELQAHAEAATLVRVSVFGVRLEAEGVDAVRSLLDEIRRAVDSFPGVMDALVQSQAYLAEVNFQRLAGDETMFFNAAIMYLAHTPLEQVPEVARRQLAAEVGVAALVARRVFNFGELLQHPIVQTLRGTEDAWLLELLLAFNQGDISGHERLMAAHGRTVPRLAAGAEFLAQKVRLMALVDLVFHRASDDRVVSFADVSRACRVDEGAVEVLLLKAFAHDVVRGTIDEVDRVVFVSWVQPRVLEPSQIRSMAGRLKDWSSRVDSAAVLLEANSREILGVGH